MGFWNKILYKKQDEVQILFLDDLVLFMAKGFVNIENKKKFQPTSMFTFDLWMSRGLHDTFVIVINFLLTNWKPHHVIIALLKANDTTVMG